MLSGTGSDGVLCVRTIKGEGGTVMAQNPGATEFDAMPAQARTAGGKGFGMRVVRLLVEDQMQGKLRVESARGTRVVCEIGGQK